MPNPLPKPTISQVISGERDAGEYQAYVLAQSASALARNKTEFEQNLSRLNNVVGDTVPSNITADGMDSDIQALFDQYSNDRSMQSQALLLQLNRHAYRCLTLLTDVLEKLNQEPTDAPPVNRI